MDQEALAALQEEERNIALANFECSEDMQEEINAISAEYETGFINENRAVLDELRDEFNN